MAKLLLCFFFFRSEAVGSQTWPGLRGRALARILLRRCLLPDSFSCFLIRWLRVWLGLLFVYCSCARTEFPACFIHSAAGAVPHIHSS
jgi:hypothetical protein